MHRDEERRERIAAFERLCRQSGLALTVQRRIIFEALLGRRDHPTADLVYEAVLDRLPGVSRTTVYRVLETLVKAGVIVKACHPGAAARYDSLTHRHHHLVCMVCEKVEDVEDPRLDDLPLPHVPRGGFAINDYCVHFRGICAECRAKEKNVPTPARGSARSSPAAVRRPSSKATPKRRKSP